MSASVEKLEAARALIARPGGWTQKCFARDANGMSVHERSRHAVCWCSYGALHRVTDYDTRAAVFLLEAVENRPLADWNDALDRTQADVVAAFDRAIALAKAEVA